MKNKEDLRASIQRIDHKSYGMYKTLAGSYSFGDFILHIDHVQGDPFASPSRLRIEIPKSLHGFPGDAYDNRHRRVAAEDRILRIFHRNLRKAFPQTGKGRRTGEENREFMSEARYEASYEGGQEGENRGRGRMAGTGGSGKSGRISTCPAGQTVLERIAVHFSSQALEFRFELGFPARGRTILGRDMIELVCQTIPDLAIRSFFYRKWAGQDRERLQEALELADDQAWIRAELVKRRLTAFVADGARLPRESGVSDRPMRDCVPFKSPESLRVEMDLPHRGRITGMGIPEGITVIVGGGYHGKSTLLKALEQGVYNHIAGDGREYVLTRDDAMKIRAEDGRSVKHSDISLFIRNLPNGQDTRDFSTDNASGSTSQAANLVEAAEAGSGIFLLDEDTSATNFMIRDQVMAGLVSDDKEPITTLLKHIKGLSCQQGLSFVIVIGSSGDYLSVADLVLQMDHYRVYDVTQKAKEVVRQAGLEDAYPETDAAIRGRIRKLNPGRNFANGNDQTRGKDYAKGRDHARGSDYRKGGEGRIKLKAAGTDTVMIDRESIDVRYLEQLSENGQTICLAYLMAEILKRTRQTLPLGQLIDGIYQQIEKEGLVSIIPRGYSCGHPSYARKQELYACLNRYRKADIGS